MVTKKEYDVFGYPEPHPLRDHIKQEKTPVSSSGVSLMGSSPQAIVIRDSRLMPYPRATSTLTALRLTVFRCSVTITGSSRNP